MSRIKAASAGSSEHKKPDEPYNATVTDWVDLSDELAIFRVKPDSGQVPEFTAGQFAMLALPRNHPPIADPKAYPPDDPRWKKLVRRAYSIASSPLERDYLEFYVVMVEDGKLTPKIWDQKAGSRIWLDSRINGDFTLDGVPDQQDLVMVSTGTGLAPYISMYKTYRNTGRWRRFVMIHGVRYQQDLGYREELEKIAAEDDSFIYIPTLSREPEDSNWQGLRGRVSELLEPEMYKKLVKAELDPDDAHVYLCGNPAMIDQCEGMLVDRGFVVQTKKQPGNLHFERYW
ncbi:MAG: ferredoxin--NADP reductase [Phycisphaeraceae bacterium]